jgi:hypothetical protein
MIAQNIAHAAVLAGHHVLFKTAAELLLDLGAQESARGLGRRLNYCATRGLFVIDEIGYLSYDARAADLLFQVVSRRYERRSRVLTTNLPFSEWPTIFPNAATATALIDRVVHHAEIITIEGESYRPARGGGQAEVGARAPGEVIVGSQFKIPRFVRSADSGGRAAGEPDGSRAAGEPLYRPRGLPQRLDRPDRASRRGGGYYPAARRPPVTRPHPRRGRAGALDDARVARAASARARLGLGGVRLGQPRGPWRCPESCHPTAQSRGRGPARLILRHVAGPKPGTPASQSSHGIRSFADSRWNER